MKNYFCVLLTLLSFRALARDLYHEDIRPIFENRCIQCHSCYNAPCQFNLQSYDGFKRGASKELVYNGTRLESTDPTRMWVDAQTTEDWRKKKFYSVSESTDPQKSLLYRFLHKKEEDNRLPGAQVEDSYTCPDDISEANIFFDTSPERYMPYGLPALTQKEKDSITAWIRLGTPGPLDETLKKSAHISPNIQRQKNHWEVFFNGKSLREKLVARYLYEHLFIAHLHFDGDEDTSFYRLIRTSGKCEENNPEIPTRRPNDDPKVPISYCLRKFPGTVVLKTHLPFELSDKKLRRIKDLFLSPKWEVKELPSYGNQIAENPFKAFDAIPVRSRYQFLLDDAHYIINTFIRGPVCNGSQAVNSIQEQFWVSFIAPGSDLMVLSSEFVSLSRDKLILPGVWGSDIELLDTPKFMAQLIENREAYRLLREEWMKKLHPKGYSLKDLWDGEGHNPNALLTVFRHDDNAVVKMGYAGATPKTSFYLDYALLERLVYNLVTNFDVFGNVGHQMLTRIYMDLIRMEGEEIYLSFLPLNERKALRNSWYKGFFTKKKMSYLFPDRSQSPTQVQFKTETGAREEFAALFLASLKPAVITHHPTPEAFKSISGVRKPFARYFPDFSLVLVRGQTSKKLYSIIHNREHENVSWIFAENLRLAPEEDTLTVLEGVWGSYPNMYFDLAEKDLPRFLKAVEKVDGTFRFEDLIQEFGSSRKKVSFWTTQDDIQKEFLKDKTIDKGYLDLTRYWMR